MPWAKGKFKCQRDFNVIFEGGPGTFLIGKFDGVKSELRTFSVRKRNENEK